MTLGLAVLSLAIWVYLLLGHGMFWQAGPALTPALPSTTPAPPVTVVVPARNEAGTVERSLRSLLAQSYPGSFRVILVDDGSTDGTGERAQRIGDRRLSVLDGGPRPDGWSGKLWALEQGIATADTGLLLLTDADIEHDPRHLLTLVAKAEGDGLDLVSEMVRLPCASEAERWIVPAFVFFFALLYPFASVNDSCSRTAAAAGGTVLIRRDALARIGGLAAMRDALIDDVTLAARVKTGGRIYLGHSRLAASIRPYASKGDLWRMVARTAFVQLRRNWWLLAGTVAGMLLVFLAPPLLTLFAHGKARVASLFAWALMTLSYLPTLRRFGLSPLRAPLLPLVAFFYTAATIGSALDSVSGRGVVWKGRAYG